MPPRARHRHSGFTLLELLVVAMLMVGLAMITARMWKYFRFQNANLTQRCTASSELSLAVESLRQDMGNVLWATPAEGDQLFICTPAANDQGQAVIQYYVADRLLMRYDQSTGASVPVAAGIHSFVAENATDTVLRLVIAVDCGADQRQATFMWSRP